MTHGQQSINVLRKKSRQVPIFCYRWQQLLNLVTILRILRRLTRSFRVILQIYLSIGKTLILANYIDAAMEQAIDEIIEDEGTYFGQIPGFQGVWA